MIEQIWNQRGLLQTALVLGLLFVAIRKGAAPERWCAAILVTAVFLIRVENLIANQFQSIWGLSGFERPDLAYLALDLLTFAGLAVVGIAANRIYPLWMAGFLLTAVVTHIASRTTDIVSPLAHAVLNLSTFYLAMVALAVGFAAHIRRERRWGTYPSWRGDLPRLPATRLRRWPNG